MVVENIVKLCLKVGDGMRGASGDWRMSVGKRVFRCWSVFQGSVPSHQKIRSLVVCVSDRGLMV